jgi:hypothetical protein
MSCAARPLTFLECKKDAISKIDLKVRSFLELCMGDLYEWRHELGTVVEGRD